MAKRKGPRSAIRGIAELLYKTTPEGRQRHIMTVRGLVSLANFVPARENQDYTLMTAGYALDAFLGTDWVIKHISEGRNDAELDLETGLVRAADLIGQLGDPHYLRKTNALFYEFAETGVNERLGYATAADIVDRYPLFLWEHVAQQVEPAVRHLNVTVEGRRWIAHLHANVFGAERHLPLGGPQP